MQEINGMEGDVVTMSELLSFHRRGVNEDGKIFGVFKATGIVPGFYEHMVQRGIDLPMSLFDPDQEWSDKNG